MAGTDVCSRWVNVQCLGTLAGVRSWATWPTWISETDRGMAEAPRGGNKAYTQVEGCWRPGKAAAAQGFGLAPARCPRQGVLYIRSPSPHGVTSDANSWIPG